MSGRAAGYCAGYGGPGYANPVGGRGAGMGFGWGRGFGGRGGGWGRGFGGGGRGWNSSFGAAGGPGYGVQAVSYSKPDPQTEKRTLQDQAEMLRTEMESIQKRLSELDDAGREK